MPVVTPELPGDPVDCAVPRLLVPLASLAPGCDSRVPLVELFGSEGVVPRPAAFPDGEPIAPLVPVPTVPAAVPVEVPAPDVLAALELLPVVPLPVAPPAEPAVAPPAAPPLALAPPPVPPPPEPPPPPPPPLWAKTAVAVVRPAITINVPKENLAIGCSPFRLQPHRAERVPEPMLAGED
ncbi:hypothetical protein BRAO375_210001 [Bradyrhizobium sp. ORS 375]|nr:hypothetical protein BRAO375_210001 [Bradyrhizobium sp. ORS 375]